MYEKAGTVIAGMVAAGTALLAAQRLTEIMSIATDDSVTVSRRLSEIKERAPEAQPLLNLIKPRTADDLIAYLTFFIMLLSLLGVGEQAEQADQPQNVITINNITADGDSNTLHLRIQVPATPTKSPPPEDTITPPPLTPGLEERPERQH